MPAPSNMFGHRQSLPLNSSHRTSRNSSPQENTMVSNGNQRDINVSMQSSSGEAERTNPSLEWSYDEVFVSRPISEVKTMLWEIKDFDRIVCDRVERAMGFEFEIGRLGSMERHLPRRSRWKLMLDMEDIGNFRVPAIRVLQLSPENKTIFYQLDACILKSNEVGSKPNQETDYRTQNCVYKEAIVNNSRSRENLLPIRRSLGGTMNPLDQIRDFIYEGSLFIKIKIEILEDAST